MANITVKATNGTTDVIYVAKSPSAGDSVPARWRADALGASANLKPELSMVTRDNGPKTGRRVTLEFSWPHTYTDTTTGLVKVAEKAPGMLTLLLPKEMPDTQINEAVDQFCNLIASTLVRASLKEGFAPT
jgi:hypothetical protein